MLIITHCFVKNVLDFFPISRPISPTPIRHSPRPNLTPGCQKISEDNQRKIRKFFLRLSIRKTAAIVIRVCVIDVWNIIFKWASKFMLRSMFKSGFVTKMVLKLSLLICALFFSCVFIFSQRIPIVARLIHLLAWEPFRVEFFPTNFPPSPGWSHCEWRFPFCCSLYLYSNTYKESKAKTKHFSFFFCFPGDFLFHFFFGSCLVFGLNVISVFRLWAEVFHVAASGAGQVKWQQVSEDLVPVNITCIQDSPECVFHITAYNSQVDKILDVRLVQPGMNIKEEKQFSASSGDINH